MARSSSASKVKAVAGGGVQARKLPYIGVGGRVEDLLRPADRLEPLTHERQRGGVSGDRHRSDKGRDMTHVPDEIDTGMCAGPREPFWHRD